MILQNKEKKCNPVSFYLHLLVQEHKSGCVCVHLLISTASESNEETTDSNADREAIALSVTMWHHQLDTQIPPILLQPAQNIMCVHSYVHAMLYV